MVALSPSQITVFGDPEVRETLARMMGRLKMPPNGGDFILPQSDTFAGRYTGASKMYYPSDEALRDSLYNARAMRNHTLVMECVEARQRSSALLGWHLDPEDQKDQKQQDLCRELTAIIETIPNFMLMRFCLNNAQFFGRYAVQYQYEAVKVRGKYRTGIVGWKPVHGDKLVFPIDGNDDYPPGTFAIRVYSGGNKEKIHGFRPGKIVPTTNGMAYLLDEEERDCVCVHKHLVEDGDYNDPQSAGSIHGVGIRSRIYAEWYQMQEVQAYLMRYVERGSLGIQIWPFLEGNVESEARVRTAATTAAQSGNTTILVPVNPTGDGMSAHDWAPIVLEPGLGGAQTMIDLLQNFFGHRIKRYVLGQTLTTEAGSTGLGSTVGEAHRATFADIIRFDAINLEETLTEGLVEPLKRLNFPDMEDVRVRFKVDTEVEDPKEMLESIQTAINCGLKVKADDLYKALGLSKPEEGDETLSLETISKMNAAGGASLAGMFGQGGGPNDPSSAPGLPAGPLDKASGRLANLIQNHPQLARDMAA